MPTPCHLIGLEKFKPATPITTGLSAYGHEGVPSGCELTGFGLIVEVARRSMPVSDAYTGRQYEQLLAARAAVVRDELDRLAAEAVPVVRATQRSVPRITGRPWDTIRICNCSACGARLLGESDEPLRQTVRAHARKRLPPPVAVRVDGRPRCAACA